MTKKTVKKKKLTKKLTKKYVTYDGQLEVYYETGMECLGLCLYKDGFEKPNPNYKKGSTTWPECVPILRCHEGLEYIDKGDILTVMKEDGFTPERKLTIEMDWTAWKEYQYRLSIYPKGVTSKELFDWFAEQNPDGTPKKPRRAILKKLLK